MGQLSSASPWYPGELNDELPPSTGLTMLVYVSEAVHGSRMVGAVDILYRGDGGFEPPVRG